MKKLCLISLVIVLVIALVGGLILTSCEAPPTPTCPTPGKKTIYVDTSGIDARTDLTNEQKQELKKWIIWDIQYNFDAAVGEGKVEVTNDPAKEAGSDRQVRIKNDMGKRINKKGEDVYRYGEWKRKATEVGVHLKNFMERHGDDYKTGGNWDIQKLRRGIGRTCSHELGHSYSIGHNSNSREAANKMTKGRNVPSVDRANEEWVFDTHSENVLKKNICKSPCKKTTDYDEEVLIAHFYDEPDSLYDLDDYGAVDALFSFSGPHASEFELGWYGVDTDEGVIDGSSEFDFIYKTSMLPDPEQNAEMITFFEGISDEVQFLLRGAPGSLWEDEWFLLDDENVVLEDFVETPDGDVVARIVSMGWDVDGESGLDVQITLDAANAFGEYSNPWNGFTYEYVTPDEIVIGRSVSMTGPNAMLHYGAGYPIMELFEIMVNGDCGGVLCGNTPCTCVWPDGWGQGILLDAYGADYRVPIEFLVYDDASNVGNLLENTRQLIEEDQVDFMWAGTGTWAILAQSTLVNDYEYVLMTLEGGATDIKEYYIEDLPYLFVTQSFSDWYQLPILAKMVVDAHKAAYAGALPEVFVSYIEDQLGYEYRDVAITEFGKLGVTIAEEDTYPMSYEFTDWDDVLDSFIAGDYDFFCSFAYPVHVFPLTAKFVEHNFNPDGIIMGPGACFGFYPYFTGVGPANVEGIMSFATANNDTIVPGATVTMDWLFDSIATIMDGFPPPDPCPGFFWNDFWGHSLYWAMCEIFKTAVEEVGYVNQYLLKEQLASYNSQLNGIDTILGPTWYTMFGDGGGILDYECHTGSIGQWKYDVGTNTSRIEIVGYPGITTVMPNYRITGNFTYPMKDNWNWLP